MPTNFVLTRLHARYAKDALGNDLVFLAYAPRGNVTLASFVPKGVPSLPACLTSAAAAHGGADGGADAGAGAGAAATPAAIVALRMSRDRIDIRGRMV